MNVAILAKYIYLEVQCRQSPLKMKTLKRTKNFLIFIEFIGVTLVNKIYRFQAYKSVIYHLYVVLCVHHPSQVSFRHHLSPLSPLLPATPPPYPLVITTLLSVSVSFFVLLCFVLLNPFTYLTQPPTSLPL